MKFILTILFMVAGCLTSAFSQTVLTEPQRFSYHLWGSVADEKAHPMPGISVCFIPAMRPINGRIPCTRTDSEGNFAFTVKDVPDRYIVSASTKDTPVLFVGDEEKGYRAKSSEMMEFEAKDECRRVTLQFESKRTLYCTLLRQND